MYLWETWVGELSRQQVLLQRRWSDPDPTGNSFLGGFSPNVLRQRKAIGQSKAVYGFYFLHITTIANRNGQKWNNAKVIQIPGVGSCWRSWESFHEHDHFHLWTTFLHVHFLHANAFSGICVEINVSTEITWMLKMLIVWIEITWGCRCYMKTKVYYVNAPTWKQSCVQHTCALNLTFWGFTYLLGTESCRSLVSCVDVVQFKLTGWEGQVRPMKS